MGETHSSHRRREYLRKSAALLGASVTVGTASATSTGWSVYASGRDEQRSIRSNLVDSTSRTDEYKPPFQANAAMGAAIYATDWNQTSENLGPKNWSSGIKMCTSSATSGPKEIVESTHSTNWYSQGKNAVTASPDEQYIGGYDGGDYEKKLSDVSAGIASSAVTTLVGTGLSLATGFTGAGILVSMTAQLLDSADAGSNSYNRKWKWGSEEHTSTWTFYELKAEEGKTLTIDQAQITKLDIIGNENLFVGYGVDLEPPSNIDFPESESFTNLSKENYGEYDMLRKQRSGKRDLYASSGKYARENPTEFSLPDDELRTLDQDAIVLRAPVNLNPYETRQSPSDF